VVNKKNILIPEMRVLNPEEKSLLLEKYKIKSTNKLPKIKISDPSLEEIETEVGEIIEILRDGEFGKVKYFREVVEK
jgi:DNA-directed RNA polymerase subunit H (RpoH/RPB5)